MKKIIALSAAMFVLCTAGAAVTSAEGAQKVSVTIADKDGNLALAMEEIELSDADGDGALTINDALYIAHENSFEGGAAAGYGTANTQYGLSMTKLWGTENGGGYGYYVNNNSAWSLADAVKDGDCINAFVYTDLEAYSDTYSFFDVNTADLKQGDSITLTLSCIAYDADYNVLNVPVEGAYLTVNGVKTDAVTDKDGKAELKIDTAGSVIVSAKSDSMTLVPPVCALSVEADPDAPSTEASTDAETEASSETEAASSASPQTGDAGTGAFAAAVVLSAAAALALRKKHEA